MLNLIRADFLKAKKDKAIVIALIFLLFFAIVDALIVVFAGDLMSSEVPAEMDGLIGAYDSGKALFLNSYYLSNNIGLLIPLIICLFIGKEFNYGTIRNKLIIGKSRTTVYLSNLVSGVALGSFLITVYVIFSLILGIVFVGYGSVLNGAEVLFILKTYILGLLIYIVSFSISVFISLTTKNQTIAVILNLVTLLILGLIVMGISKLFPESDKILDFIIFGQSMTILSGEITNVFALKVISSSIVATVGISYLGIYLFKKSDLK